MKTKKTKDILPEIIIIWILIHTAIPCIAHSTKTGRKT